LIARFGDRILPVTVDIAHGWGKLMSDARRRGIGLATMDAFLAATANHHRLTLVSGDADLVPFCEVLNPFNR
jgi:predicted nucleic acid-binding protein